MARPSIYEYAGGDAAFARLAEKHHARCLADPELNHPFSHGDLNPKHVERLGAYWAEVFGGPAVFPGGHSAMLAIHACQGMPDEFGRRFQACFDQAVVDAGLPAEVRPALAAYMDWAVREVIRYSPHGSVVPPDLPTPRWGWDGPIA